MRRSSAAPLFDAIHDGRPERLAQLVLAHVLRTEPEVRALLGLPRRGVVNVVSELRVADTRWRADIVVCVGRARKSLELKLSAPLSPQQRDADARRKIDWLVHQSGGRTETCNARRVAWSDVAACVADPTARAILRDADRARSFWREAIDADLVQSALDALVPAPRASARAAWFQMYAFLSTIDAHLRRTDDGYSPSSGWTVGRSPRPYYGFNFAWADAEPKTRPWWVGFERDAGGVPRLRLYSNGELSLARLPLRVPRAVLKITDHLTASSGRWPRMEAVVPDL